MVLEANISMVTQCLLLVLATVISKFIISYWDFYVKGSKLPGPVALPIIGNLLQFTSNKLNVTDTIYKATKQYNGMCRLWFANLLAVIITDPEHLQTFYSSQTMLEKAEQYDSLADVIGHTGIFISGGERWKRLRKMFMVTFNPTPTDLIMKNFKICADYLVEKFRAKSDGKYFEAYMNLRVTTTQAIFSNSMGRFETEKTCEWLMDGIEYLAKVSYIRQFSLKMRWDFIFDLTAEGKNYRKVTTEVHQYMLDLVIERKALYKELKEKGEPIPNIYIFNMIEKYEKFPLMELRDEVMTLLMAGLDTTAGAVGFVLILLALHPEYQEQLYQEDQEIQKSIAGREINMDDLQKYELLERVIKETLRIFPVAPLIGRKVPEDTYLGKHLVPKGASIVAFPLYTYRNPDLFPDPLKFNPDRFLPANLDKRHQYSYNPFSAGPRGCPGMRYAIMGMKMYLSGVIRTFKIGCQYKTLDEVLKNNVAEVTLTDVNHYPISVTPRS